MSHALVTRALKKHFKSNFRTRTIKALDGISLGVERGEIFGFIGHNGAGKTTAIKILTGLIKPTGGEAEVMGCRVGDWKALGEIGFLPERPYFYEYLTARETLMFYGRLNNMSSAAIRRRADELLEMLDLGSEADRPTGSYSKGMLQRLGMAQAVLHDPQLVILDEPMSGLDPIGRGKIKDIIYLLKEEGKTVFFSTHLLVDAEQLCDRIALIARGRLSYVGRVEELTSRYEAGVEFALGGLSGDQAEFVDKLPGVLSRKGDTAVLFLRKEADFQKVLRELVAREIVVEAMTPRRMSLEDVVVREFRQEEVSGEDTGDRS